MSNRVTLGGERIGSGNKMQVEMHGFERSNHDLSYIFRSTMSQGTLVPFLCMIGLPGDTIDIKLNSECYTHPTVGPLFGSSKAQYDVYQIPLRLYNSWLHNNKLDIGNDMQNVKLPQMRLVADPVTGVLKGDEQINPSSILSYLGIRGVGHTSTQQNRDFMAAGWLAYWEIVKQYYANKQEGIGAVIHTDNFDPNPVLQLDLGGFPLTEYPATTSLFMTQGSVIFLLCNEPITTELLIRIKVKVDFGGGRITDFYSNLQNINITGLTMTAEYNGQWGDVNFEFYQWYGVLTNDNPQITTFPLTNIDTMREALLGTAGNVQFNTISQNYEPYNLIDTVLADGTGRRSKQFSQEGLALKTYQSDIYNNWLNETWINSITSASAISTLSGGFTMDEFIIKRKIWEVLNRVAVSGGSYNDWVAASYDQKAYNRAETPIYIGGLSKEIVFQEVINNSGSKDQPLGTLAGRGRFNGKHKGGKVVAKCDEHCIIMGIVSITPRIDYSQGNEWFTHLQNFDEFHKPGLDQIGFQDLITEQMAWWTTVYGAGQWIQKTVGKQPAWINYMTNVNKTYGNFAVQDNEMFMTFNRRYEYDPATADIKDMTTYIDPAKYNYIFAQTELDAQNYWMQIGVDIEARRKMSAKIMPNL